MKEKINPKPVYTGWLGLLGLLWATSACQGPTAWPAPPPVTAAQAIGPTGTPAAGRVETVTLRDTRLGVAKSFNVYLPPDYPNHGPYPTVYLLRGTMDEWLNPTQDPSRQGRTAVTVYETLRRAGKVGDLIMVCPGLGSDDGRWPGILANWRTPPEAPGVGSGRFADYLFQDLIPAVDNRFRTLKDSGHRAIDGFSLGGWAAVQAAATHPGTFASVGAFDGTYPYAKDARHADPDDELWEADFFDPIFGKPKHWATVTEASPINRLAQGSASQWGRIQWLVQYCPQEIEPRGNFYRGAELVQVLAAHGGKNKLGTLPNATHSWWNADEHLQTTLPMHWQVVKPSAP